MSTSAHSMHVIEASVHNHWLVRSMRILPIWRRVGARGA